MSPIKAVFELHITSQKVANQQFLANCETIYRWISACLDKMKPFIDYQSTKAQMKIF